MESAVFHAGFGQTLGGGGAARAPNAEGAPNPTSSIMISSTFGAPPAGGRSGSGRVYGGILIGVVHGGRDVRRLGNDRNGMAIHQQAPWRVQNRAD